ncbi:thiamine biosynthesis protein ThiS [Marinicauda salina]|uniref:Thiamine biosynthesis protein ThiS n=1 Tax=Marinicauda salina TaxID=2135793 RepID=A0A2U2BTH3_9PROT|nr:sulfur carrier protein ThiS [Marinicauda salina]PWE17313.1 thiamine biosynthesis protein ThiS [Marinicauda salina]
METSDDARTDLITVTINGEPRELAAGLSLDDLLRSLDLDPRKVAVERNLEIAPRSAYDAVRIEAGDRLEIVHFVGGG